MVVTAFSVLTRLMSFVFHVFLSRRLGAENIGVFHIACSTLFMFMCFSSSGFPVTLSRKIAQYDAIGDYTHSDSLLTSTLIMTTLISTTICAFFMLFPSVLNLLFSNEKCHSVFLLLLPAMIAGSIYATLRAWFWGKKKYLAYSLVETLDEAMLIITVLILLASKVYVDSEYNTLALAHSIADAVCMIVLIIAFIFMGGKMSKPRHIHELTSASAPITTTRIITSLIASMTALILPSLLVRAGLTMSEATAEFGRMSGMAMPIIMAPGTIVSSLIIVMIPELASDVSKHGMKSIHTKVRSSILFSIAVSGFFMAIFLVCGRDVATLFYDDPAVGNMIVYSSLVTIPLVLNQLTTSVLNTLGKENWTFSVCIVCSIGLVATIGLSADSLNIFAYPLGLFVYHTLGLVLNSIKLLKTTEMSGNYNYAALLIAVISLAIAALVALISNSYTGLHIFTRLVLSTIIITIFFSLILIPLGMKIYRNRNNSNDKNNTNIVN